MKRIAKVTIKHILDENPDTSFIGEYTDDASDWCIVRQEGEFLAVLEEQGVYQLPSRGRECRFFIPYAGGEKPGTENYIKYGMQDYKRMERLNEGNWCFIGIVAIAEVQTSQDGKLWQSQKISSFGLWGIESDSDEEYIKSVQQEQLADLKTQLLEFGFSRHQIYRAFERVEVSE